MFQLTIYIYSKIYSQDRFVGHFHVVGDGVHRSDGRRLQIPSIESLQSGQSHFSMRHSPWLRHHVRRGIYETVYLI